MNTTSQFHNAAVIARRLFCALLISAACIAANAATYTWTGAGFFGDKDYLWSNPANWAGLGAPSTNDSNITIVFPNNTSARVTTNDIAGLKVASVQFLGTNYVVHGKPAGNTLTLLGNNGAWTVLGSYEGCYFAGTMTLALGNRGNIAVASGVTFSILSTITGPGGFTKLSPGTLKLSGAAHNTFAGSTAVLDGTMDLAGGVLFPNPATYVSIPGALSIGDTNMSLSPRVRLLLDNQIGNGSAVTVNDNGRLWLNGKDDTIGSLSMTDGSEVVTGENGGDTSPGLLTLNGDVSSTKSPYANMSWFRGRLDLGMFPRTFDVAGWLRIYGRISGTGITSPGITKIGSGSLQFIACTNSYVGPTIVESGYLHLVGGSTPLGSTNSGTSVATGSSLYLEGVSVGAESLALHGNDININLEFRGTNSWAGPVSLTGPCRLDNQKWLGDPAHQMTFSGPIGGSGGLRKTGEDGIVRLTGNTANTFGGTFYCDEGTLVLDKNGQFAIPGNLVIGTQNYGAPAALVVATQPYQFRAYGFPDHRVTVNPSGVFDAGVYDQTISNLEMRDGWTKAIGGKLLLMRDLTVEPGPGGHSYLMGGVSLLYGDESSTHNFEVRSNAVLWCLADIREDPFEQHLKKTGTGTLLLSGSNGFGGTVTIEAGTLVASGIQPLGNTDGGTVVKHGGTLSTITLTTSEALSLAGAGYNNGGALHTATTNVFMGPIGLNDNALILVQTNGFITFSGYVNGGGGLIKDGPGTLKLSGTVANSYYGATIIYNGRVELAKTNATAIPGDLTISGVASGAYIQLMRQNQISDDSFVTLTGTGWISLNGFNETIGALSGGGAIFQGANQFGVLTVGGNNVATTFNGVIHGGTGLTKTGTNTLTLTGNSPYFGATTVLGGTLMVFGQQPNSAVSLISGGNLAGPGRVGNLTDFSGHIFPGAGIGILVCSNFHTFSSGNRLEVEINGPTPGTGHDQLKVYGTVNLAGGSLLAITSLPSSATNQFVIIDNDGADAVIGTFTGLPEGSILTNNGVALKITYQGGDGNDVVLMREAVGIPAQLTDAIRLANGTFQIKATGGTNTLYVVEATESLTAPIVWTVIGEAPADGLGQLEFTDADAGLYQNRFYRLRQP